MIQGSLARATFRTDADPKLVAKFVAALLKTNKGKDDEALIQSCNEELPTMLREGLFLYRSLSRNARVVCHCVFVLL